METLSQLIVRTVKEGAPLYNKGQIQECFEIYLETCNHILQQQSDALVKSKAGTIISQEVKQVEQLDKTNDDFYKKGAWILRRAFDQVIESDGRLLRSKVRVSKKQLSSCAVKASSGKTNKDKESEEGSTSEYSYFTSGLKEEDGWQDDKVPNSSDYEKGQALAHAFEILQATLPFQTSSAGQATFLAWQAIQALLSMGVSSTREDCLAKCRLLKRGGYLVAVLDNQEAEDVDFEDGTDVYRLGTRAELQQKLDSLMKQEPSKCTLEGYEQHLLSKALQATLEEEGSSPASLPTEDATTSQDAMPPAAAGRPALSRAATPRRSLLVPPRSPALAKGHELAEFCRLVESVVDIDNRKYRFKTYDSCFVGNDGITAVVEAGMAESREQAVTQLDELVEYGLLYHVTREHRFEDAMLFFRFTSSAEVKAALDALLQSPESTESAEHLAVHKAALDARYKQFASLDIPTILNSFYGSDDKEGWDVVNLDNWRSNMKRWGFGRREDQDDEMVDQLAPLCFNVNPDTWKPPSPEWESPWGILAQIAIFDQIPRSAFRGTPDAFRWDHLAIRATKVAIEKGYFETAYKSTLNQFVLLLPLEHSEDWEDQKLGVSLLFKLLSTVSVLDDGFSDYEIVKRLEFSKRLSVAFLEHAQVIAKFQRYPHRNKALGRGTSLEERIWLASDLVPRWARSQNPEDAKNIIQLPVIPLKKLTRR